MFTFLGLFFGFLLLGVPISLALGVGGLLYLYFTDNWMLVAALPQRMLSGVDQFILLTIPLFLLAGSLMNFGGLSTRMVNFANALVGHFKGGLSLVTVLASIMFAGISGSAIAQSSAIGSLMIPAMARQGIPAAYGAALVAMSAVIDPLIPPSITMIVFGVLSGTSIGQMFIAGIVPGLLLGLGFAPLCRLAGQAEQLPVHAQGELAGSGEIAHRRHSRPDVAGDHRRWCEVGHFYHDRIRRGRGCLRVYRGRVPSRADVCPHLGGALQHGDRHVRPAVHSSRWRASSRLP